MARNIEIKARVADLAPIDTHARNIATSGPVEIEQDDTFFACARGRLKLRQFDEGRGELIHYFRPDESGPKLSDYVISPTSSPAALRHALSRALGIIGRVRKHRRLYIAGQTRIHLDTVEGLGRFVELEVVLAGDESTQRGEAVAQELMASLGIKQTQLVEGAYVDLLTETAT